MKVNGMDFRWRSFCFYGDCGHGWLKVPYTALYRLGLVRQITGYSYIRGEWVYLEEDCDASLFISALKAYGVNYKINHRYCDGISKIRSFEYYQCGKIYDRDEFYLGVEKKTLDMIGRV